MKNDLFGALINVPVSKYKKNGKVKIDCGTICKLRLRNYHAKKPNKITRSQFKLPNRRFGFANTSELFGYLKHDYDQENQQRIRQSIHELTVPGFVSFVTEFLVPLCAIFFVFYLFIMFQQLITFFHKYITNLNLLRNQTGM